MLRNPSDIPIVGHSLGHSLHGASMRYDSPTRKKNFVGTPFIEANMTIQSKSNVTVVNRRII